MKQIRFSKAFLPCTIISIGIILFGFYGIATRGMNYGLDFKPGLMTEVRIAPTALTLGYTGVARATVETSNSGVTVIISGAGDVNSSSQFPFADYATVQQLADGIKTVQNVTAEVVPGAEDTASTALFVDSSIGTVLGAVPYRFHYGNGTNLANADDIRESLGDLEAAQVQQIGSDDENRFQIRVGDQSLAKTPETAAPAPSSENAAEGDPASLTDIAANLAENADESNVVDLSEGEEAASPAAIESLSASTLTLAQQVVSDLKGRFGDENVATISTDFVGAQFSKSLAFKSIWVVLATLVLILLYSTVRFKWDFAMGAVLAIMHDALIMLAFITWANVEFTTTILAAILTIIGYSINDTIVVLDRVRENQKTVSPATPITEILDDAQTQILSRTIITTVTTLLAVVALFLFTTGSMKDFALCLIVGMISGVYSTIYISGAFIAFVRRKR